MGKGRRNRQIDWSKIKTEYVTGNKSYRVLAKEHNLSNKLLAAKGKEEEWVKARNEWRKSTAKKAEKAAQDIAVNNIKKLENVAGMAISTLNKYFENEIGMFEPKDLKTLTGAIKDLTGVISDIKAMTTSGQQNVSIEVKLPEDMSDYDD